MANKQQSIDNKISGQKGFERRRQRRWYAGSVILLCLVVITAGCGGGPKGFVKGEAYGVDGVSLANQKLLVNVAGKSHMVTTAQDGSFEISGIALGSQKVTVSYQDPHTLKQYQWEGAVQVSIQGVKLRVQFSGTLDDFDQLIQAAWQKLTTREWEAARGYLNSLTDYVTDADEKSTAMLAWGWFYLRSGESYEKSKECFQKASDLGRVAEAKVGLAGVEAALGNYKEAAHILDEALEQEPRLELGYLDLSTGDLQVALANLYLQAGDETKALTILHVKIQGISSVGQRIKEDLLRLLEG